jgi:hypothetical protein
LMAVAENLTSIMRVTRPTTQPGTRPARHRPWPVIHGRGRSRPDSPVAPAVLRLRVFVRRRRLDRQIVAGDAGDAPELTLRVRQLTRPHSQRVLAGSLRRLVKHVDAVGRGPSLSPVIVDRSAVRANRQAILGLADRLDRAGDVSSRGMVLVTDLLTDGAASPLYRTGGGRALADAIWGISDALGTEQV